MKRDYSFLDKILNHVDLARKTLLIQPKHHQRSYPPSMLTENLSQEDKKHSAALMRVNHSGEVCAQALYQGQAITARSAEVRQKMQEAADEELDHLAWCNQRLSNLNSHASYLNIFWYLGALSIGIVAGCIGDKWSLGFLSETERQVVSHLDSHLKKISDEDMESRLIIEQMREDEAKHRDMAQEAGAANLPKWVQSLMSASSKIMTKIAYYI